MRRSIPTWLARLALLASLCGAGAALAQGAPAARSPQLVDAAWLSSRLDDDGVLLLDASPGPLHAAGHIPGAVHADRFAFGATEPSPAALQQQFQRWGVSRARRIVLYDADGMMWAARLFFDLQTFGFPLERLALLDGGLVDWKARGLAVTRDATPPRAGGDFRVGPPREDLRVRLPEFLAAAADGERHAIVDALEPAYFHGGAKFFDRAGHVPFARSMPRRDFLRPDGRFRDADELRTMLARQRIRADQPVFTYCGGGVAAAVPFFALRHIAGHRDVRLYAESQLEWLRDERGLPLWTWGAPSLLRDAAWLAGWNSPMLRSFGLARLAVVDVRPVEAFARGHLPGSVHLPAALFREHLADPAALAARLAAAGVDPAHEAVVVSTQGLDPEAALAAVMLHAAGQARSSVLKESVDEWALRGLPLQRAPASAPPPAPPVPATARDGVLVAAGLPAAEGRVFVAAGSAPPRQAVAGRLLHLPWRELLQADGAPRPAHEVWARLEKAGLSRHDEVVAVADDPAEAAVLVHLLRLMGWHDVRLALP